MKYHLLQLSLLHPLPWRVMLLAAYKYITALSALQTLRFRWRITEKLFVKDLEGFGRDLSWSTIPLFAWRTGGKAKRNLTVRIRTHHLRRCLSWFVRRGFWQAYGYFAFAIVIVKAPCFEGWFCCRHQARTKNDKIYSFGWGEHNFFLGGGHSYEKEYKIANTTFGTKVNIYLGPVPGHWMGPEYARGPEA